MNVCESVIVGAKLFPQHDAVVFEDRRWTYAQIDDLSSRAAGVLRQHGVERGDRVGIVLPNVPAFVVWYYAVLRLGAVAVSISTRLVSEEVAFILSDCQARVWLVGETNVEGVPRRLPEGGQMLVVSELADP